MSDREGDVGFFLTILCNDNDIIDMNNACSATTTVFLFLLSVAATRDP